MVVNGPRQAGKSELLRMIHASHGGSLTTLDQPQALRQARMDPTGFMADRDRPLLIDEIQRGGDPLLLALKILLDESQDRGQLMLTGSTRFLLEPRLSESLAGRIRFVDLWPLAQGEAHRLGPTSDRLADRLLCDAVELRHSVRSLVGMRRREVYERMTVGGYPEAILATDRRAVLEFFNDYVRTISQRDITELGRITQRIDLPSVLRLLAERTATTINRSKLAGAVGVTEDSMRRYLPLVETIFLTHELPAFAATTAARTRRGSKIHLTDSGLAASLLGLSVDRLLMPTTTIVGQLFETFVAMELTKQTTWADEIITMSHYRDAEDREVDIILATADGRVCGVEVKAAIDVDGSDFRHLAYLRDRLGDRFVNGVVIHCGTQSASWGDRLTSLPANALWDPPAS